MNITHIAITGDFDEMGSIFPAFIVVDDKGNDFFAKFTTAKAALSGV